MSATAVPFQVPEVMVPVAVMPLKLPVVMTVPVTLGSVIILFDVGSITARVVAKALSVVPWNTSGLAPVICAVRLTRSVAASPMVVVVLVILVVPESVVVPELVRPPENVEAVAVVAPRPVTVARVSASPASQEPHVGAAPVVAIRHCPVVPAAVVASFVPSK